MKEHGICAKCKKSVGCPYADDRITGCKNFVLEHELKLTNKEWIRQCDTEQLAEFLNLIIRVGPYENEPKDFWEHVYGCGGEHGAKSIVEWLKQPHHSE